MSRFVVPTNSDNETQETASSTSPKELNRLQKKRDAVDPRVRQLERKIETQKKVAEKADKLGYIEDDKERLAKIAQERKKAVEEEDARVEQTRLEARLRREEQMKSALHYWNKDTGMAWTSKFVAKDYVEQIRTTRTTNCS